jgi:AsmA protein
MKLFKRIVIVVAVLLLLVFAGVGIFIASFDPNTYKPQIEKLVTEKTGRTLQLKGEIGMSLFPSIGLNLGEAELGNAPGFGEQPFAQVKEVRLNVAFLPLLKGKLDVDTVVLSGLQIDLQRNAQGVTNWDDLTKEEKTQAPAAEKAPAQREEKAGVPPVELYVQGLKITDARLFFKDAQKGESLKLDPFNLETGSLAIGEPMPLSMDLHLVQGKDTDLVAKLKASVVLDPAAQRYAMNDLKLDVTIKQPDLPKGEVSAKLSADASADLKSQTASLNKLLVEVLGLSLQGGVNAQKIIDAPSYEGDFKVASFSPRELMGKLGVEAPKTADPDVLKQAELGFHVSGTDNAVNLTGLKLKLDDSQMTGKAGVSNFAKPAIRVDLALDSINLDRYMAPEGKASGKTGGAGAPGGAAQSAADDDLGIPSDTLRTLDAIFKFRLGKLVMQKATLTDAAVTVTARDGLVNVDPFKAALYGGSFNTQASLDVRGKTPKFSVNNKLSGVESAPLLKDMYGDSYLSGKANMDAALTTQGNRVSDLKRALNGKLSLAFKEGSVNDSELSGQLNKVVALIEKRPYDPSQPKSTNFSSLTATAAIKNGLIDNRDLHLVAPKFQVRGLGTVNLVTDNVDYQLRLMQPDKDGGTEHIYAPIDVKGSFANLSYRFNEKEYTSQLVEREKKKVEEKAKEKIGEEVNKALKGLFGQ